MILRKLTQHRQRRGANAVEFALLLPLWVGFVGALVDFGWLFYHQSVLDGAVAKGCRSGAILDPNRFDVAAAATTEMNSSLASGLVDCTTDPSKCGTSVGTTGDVPAMTLVCGINIDFEPLLGWVVSPVTLESRTAVWMERQS